jgi:hypothetical protein
MSSEAAEQVQFGIWVKWDEYVAVQSRMWRSMLNLWKIPVPSPSLAVGKAEPTRILENYSL